MTSVRQPAKNTSKTDSEYRVSSVTKTTPPEGVAGGNWYRYELARGSSSITGYRQGNLKDVTRAAEDIVRGLNERRFPRKGRVQLSRSTRRSGQTAQ